MRIIRPRHFIIPAILLLILNLVMYFWISNKGSDLAAQIIGGIVQNQSNNSYDIVFKKVVLSPFDKTLTLDSISLTPSTNGDNKRTLYTVFAPKLIIDLKSITEIFLIEKLTIEQISVFNPTLRIKKGKEKKLKNVSFEAGNLYQLISKYIEVFQIGQLSIKSGGLSYLNEFSERNDFDLSEIDFLVENFLMDSTQSSDRFFSTDRIKLVVTNQQFELNDDLHILNFDTLSLSTKKKSITIKGLKIAPKDSISLTNNTYHIDVPSFGLTDVDFDLAYSANHLKIGALHLNDGTVHINIAEKQQEQEQKRSSSPLANISQKLTIDQVEVSLNNSALSINKQVIDFESIHINGDSLALDSGVVFNSLDELFKDLSLQIEKPRFDRDEMNVQVGDIDYTMKTGQVNLHNISIRCSSDQHFIVDRAYLELLDNRFDQVNVKTLELYKPDIQLATNKKNNSKATSSALPKWLAMRNITIFDGTLNASEKIKVGAFNLQLKSDNIDLSSTKKFLECIDYSYLDASDWSVSQDKLSISAHSALVDDLNYVEATNISLKNEAIDLKSEKLRLTSINLDTLLNYQVLFFDSLFIEKPEGELVMLERNNSQTLHTSYEYIEIKDGQFSAILKDKTKAYATGLNLEITITDAQPSVYLKLDHLYSPSIQDHMIDVSNVMVNDDSSSISIQHIEAFPNSQTQPFQVHVKMANLSLEGNNFLEALTEDRPLYFDEGTIDSIQLFSIIGKDQLNNKSSEPKTHFYFDQLKINHLNADINKDSTLLQLENSHLQLVNIDSRETSIFNKGDISLFATNFNILKGNTSFLLDSIDFKSTEGSIHSTGSRLYLNNDTLHIESLSLNGIDLDLNQDTITIEEIKLDHPKISLAVSKKTKAKSLVKLFKVNALTITDGELLIKETGVKNNEEMVVPKINFSSTNLSFSTDFTHLKYDSLDIRLNDFSYITNDSLYQIVLGEFEYDQSGELRFSNISFTPFYNRRDFQKHIGFQKDWLNATVADITIKNWNISKFINDSSLIIDNIAISDLYLETHKDKRLPLPPTELKYLPQQYLKDSKFDIHIDTISIFNAYVSHSEYSETGTRPGFIYFQQINGNILNITNLEEKVKANRNMTFATSAVLYKTGKLLLKTEFDLDHPKNRFDMEVTLGNMDLTEMNALLENTGHLSVKSGVNKLNQFNFMANSDYAVGEMKFFYRDLKLLVLKEDEGKEEENASLKSFFANTFIVNKKNPHFLFVRRGDIYHERDDSKSIFNYWAKSALSGVVTSIGAGNNRKEIKALNMESKSKF